jgi:hypothetical protein
LHTATSVTPGKRNDTALVMVLAAEITQGALERQIDLYLCRIFVTGYRELAVRIAIIAMP